MIYRLKKKYEGYIIWYMYIFYLNVSLIIDLREKGRFFGIKNFPIIIDEILNFVIK